MFPRPLVLSALVVSVLPAHAALAKPGAFPPATTLLQRSIEAHKKLGPVSLTVRQEEMKNGKPVSTRVMTADRNDPKHYVTRFSEGPARIQLIANGEELVQYVQPRQVYRRMKNYGMDLMMPFSRIRDEVAKGLQKPETRTLLGKAIVTGVTVSGELCYRMDWMPPARLGGLPVKAVVVSRRDGLMRQVVLHEEGKATMRASIAYQHRSRPFPPETFAFTPPPGARDLDAPDDQPPSPAPVVPEPEAGSGS